MSTSATLPKTIAAVRIATSIFFILFGEYKLAGPAFAHGGFQEYLHGYIDSTARQFLPPGSGQPGLPARRVSRIHRWCSRNVYRTVTFARDLGPSSLNPRCTVHAQPDPSHLVGPRPRRPHLALFRKRTRPPPPAPPLHNLLRVRRRPALGTRRPPPQVATPRKKPTLGGASRGCFGKGPDFSRAAKSPRMCPRFSA